MGPDLSMAHWECLRPILPPAKATEWPQADDRRTRHYKRYSARPVHRLSPEDPPDRHGSPVTCWRWLGQWQMDGTGERTGERFWPICTNQGSSAGAELCLPK
jgi:transposase